jgi:flagellar motor component MotA
MLKSPVIVGLVLVFISIWLGIQIDPSRDWSSWIFILVIPFVIVIGAVFWAFRSTKKGDTNER